MELARAGMFVYATGRSSWVSGRSEIGRPETIEETGDRIREAGGQGALAAIPLMLRTAADGGTRGLAVEVTDGTSEANCWGYLAAYGWELESGEGIDGFR